MSKIVRLQYRKYTIPLFFTLLLISLPLNVGPTIKYALSILLTALCLYNILKDKNQKWSEGLKTLNRPFAWMLGLYAFTAGASVFMSPDMGYSFRQFLEEFVLNLTLYLALSLYLAARRPDTDWFSYVKAANIIFLALYAGLLFQWVMDGAHPWLMNADIDVKGLTAWDRLFIYGNHNLIVHGIKHTSIFLLLGIAVSFVPVLWNRQKLANIMLMAADFLMLITTVRRAAIISATLGLGLPCLFRHGAARKAMAAAGAVIVFFTVLFATGRYQYFIREDWKLLLQGNVEKAKEKGGSIPLRIISLKVFTEEIMKHPFTGAGLGKKNIKRVYRKACEKTQTAHPHNILLNIAAETGIQGSVALLLVIGTQALLLLKCFKKTDSADVEIIMVTGLTFMFTFWLANLFTYAFHHGTSTLYWMFMAIPTGYALSEGNITDSSRQRS